MNFLWIVLSLLTALRFILAASGHLSEIESYLLLCSHHLDWGFVEGPAGVPAMIRLSEVLLGNTPFGIRFLSPFLLLGASWVLWKLTIDLRNRKIAFWTVMLFNCLPLANAAGMVMDGTMVVTLCWLAAFKAAWDLLSREGSKNKILQWVIFGMTLALGTQATYLVGWLLPLVVVATWMKELSAKSFFGVMIATLLLAISWLPLLWWNSHHDWLAFQGMTWNSFWSWPPWGSGYFEHLPLAWAILLLVPLFVSGACCFSGFWTLESPFFLLLSVPFFFGLNELGHGKVSFALLLVLTALFLPITVEIFFQTKKTKCLGAFLLIAISGCSLLVFLGKISSSATQESPWNFPSITGVIGTEAAAKELLQWRATYADHSTKLPFLIAETPGLAAILGAVLPVDYPERPGAPSVFIAESPALNSQFFLWPHYADATIVNTTPDPLYTEEKAVSPFLNHDAFYITTEKLEEIPQTISGAFSTIIPLNLVLPFQSNGHTEELKVYLCQSYQMLSL